MTPENHSFKAKVLNNFFVVVKNCFFENHVILERPFGPQDLEKVVYKSKNPFFVYFESPLFSFCFFNGGYCIVGGVK